MKRIAILMAAFAVSMSTASAQIAATSAKSYAKPAHRTKRFLVTDFGAVGDGKTVNTKAIQAAIDKCAATKKGGVVVVPKGTFLSGAIFLKQGANLLVEKDGVLKGTTNPDDYPQIQTRWEGTEEMYTASFVNAEGVTGLTISGEGTIDGSGEEWVQKNPYRRPPAAAPGAAPAAPGAASTAAAPIVTPPPAPAAAPAAPPLAVAARPAAPGPGTAPRRGRPRLIGIQNSKDVLLSGLNLHNQAVWCLFVLYSQNVEIDGVKITAEHNIPSSDGIDIDSSKHVHITNVFIDDDDDCISIKSGKDADGLRVNRPAEDILIENSHFAYGQGGVAMGSETSGGIRNVTVLNCVMDSGNWAPIRFKSQPSRGGVVENITYKNIALHGTRAGIRDEYGVAHGGAEAAGFQPPARGAQREDHQCIGRCAKRRRHSRPCGQPDPGRHLRKLQDHRRPWLPAGPRAQRRHEGVDDRREDRAIPSPRPTWNRVMT